MQDTSAVDFMKRLAKGLAAQFGEDCEIVIHDLESENRDNTIVAIENGHVTHREVGGGPSHIVLEALKTPAEKLEDHYDYLTKTSDGRLIKSSSIYIRDDGGKPVGIFCINYDITKFAMAESTMKNFLHVAPQSEEPERIPQNVNELLDELIDNAVRHVGKPVPMMKKADKIKAVQYLKNNGAFQILKSGDRVCKLFKISKFTLYNYIDSMEPES
ncbi:helix-turn-helix transcriptional regulator [Cloacibacillus evryensis]|uniref:helix-turn-helix transcriptional regulator n=2 Tax=Cloacibacillus evryensis TaxID=508460 RepID=UPI0004B2A625|nr:helix-turn-helix transcriptional regulator [Cloacibacillus evryensis]MCQ4763414.1 helix-turn-helix transcriptional regulator [Cloacibacillus evryensis]MEA5035385.1 helix-turn-helix transcriptional regulator [Cloacibacillus evryensis]